MKNLEAKDSTKKERWAAKRRATSPVLIDMSQEKWVELGHLQSGQTLPLVVQPKVDGIDLAAWIGSNFEYIQNLLFQHGGILFRGFPVRTKDDLARVFDCMPLQLMYYMEGATPRTELADKIYTSTEFPSDQTIMLHNELCYVTTWPMKIWFFSVKPAEKGGETPIGDVRKVFQRLDPKIKEPFMEKGWMLVRNFGDGMGLPWQASYRVADKSELEAYFRKSRIEFEWKDNNRLRTRQVRSPVAVHPKTGEMVWFNHVAFWHVSSLQPKLREMFLKEYSEQDLPFSTYYGDGSPIEDSVIEAIREAYREETVAFLWQAGDLLMLDNMLTAHGRFTFEGRREVLTAMGEPFSNADIR
jgi:alpha-ketoglutarate-dependent taurine dioxygenase